MRLPALTTRDTLDVAALPPTDNTELNYRTRPLKPMAERLQTGRLLISSALFIAPVGLVVSWFWSIKWLILPAMITGAMMLLARAFFRIARERKRPWLELTATGVIIVSALLGWLFRTLPSFRIGYGAVFPLAVAWATGFSLIVAKQFACWMANHPKVEWETARKWESFFVGLWHDATPPECPEIRSVRFSPILLLASYGLGWGLLLRVERTGSWEFAALWGLLGFAASLIMFTSVWNLFGVGSRFSLLLTFRVTWNAVIVWCNYNRAATPAAGVFRFPTPPLRLIVVRDTLLWATLVVVGVGLLACFPSLIPAPSPAASAKPVVLPHEEEFLKTLPLPEAEKKRNEILALRTPKPRPWQETIGAVCERLVIGVVLLTIGPALLLFLVMWAVTGPLLTRFYLALEAPNGYAQSEDSEWDVSVNRIIESNDSLEKEHYLLGTSLVGDYPVLLHQNILNQHYHMTGDSGAAKTSLGMAPLATQMIVRGKNSVVVIDLKGDMSLFETMRQEAEWAGLPFRWFSSEPGKTSHVFNPFVQSHLRLLTPEQRTESLLQAMSLDYGLGYGKAFFTAMNEVVLKNMLRKYSIRSFKELEGYLEDPASYKDLGPKKDFEAARHLAVIVNRLAGMYPLNIVSGGTPGEEQAASHAIDAMDVLHRPQVVYFFLNSPQEPIGAPSVAKLFLWALFSAAARNPARDNRAYVFVDEFQQIISDSVKLVFEQIRDLGVTMIVGHQSPGQLKRQGTDLAQTIESCTAVKHIFRASETETMKKIEEASGQAVYHSLGWMQTLDLSALEEGGDGGLSPEFAVDGMVQVGESMGPLLDRNTVIRVSANPQASFVRFTSGSGYTQFGGFTTTIISPYMIPFSIYELRKKVAWPTGTGTVVVPYPADTATEPEPPSKPDDDWEDRLRRSLGP